MATVGELRVLLKADTSGFDRDVGNAGAGLAKLNMAAGAAAVGLAAVAAAVTATAVAITAVTKHALDMADRFTNLAEKTKLGTEALQKYDIAGKAFGITAESIATAALRGSANIAKGSDEVAKAAKLVGSSVSELRGLAPEEQFQKIAEGLAKIPNHGQEAAAAMTLLGRGGLEILPALSKGFMEAANEAERLGFVLDAQTVAAVDNTGDRIALLGSGFDALLSKLGATIAGNEQFKATIEVLIQGLSELIGWIDRNQEGLSNLVSNGIVFAIRAIAGLLEMLSMWVAAYVQVTAAQVALGESVAGLVGWIGKVIAAIPGLAGVAKPILDIANSMKARLANDREALGAMSLLSHQMEQSAVKAVQFADKMEKGAAGTQKASKAAREAVGSFSALGDEMGDAEKKFRSWADSVSKQGLQKEVTELGKNLARLEREGLQLTAKSAQELGKAFSEARTQGAQLNSTAQQLADTFERFEKMDALIKKSKAAMTETGKFMGGMSIPKASRLDVFDDQELANFNRFIQGNETDEWVGKIRGSMKEAKNETLDWGRAMENLAHTFEVFGIKATSTLGIAARSATQLAPMIAATIQGGARGGFEQSTLGHGSAAERVANTSQAVAGGISSIASATGSGSTGARAGKGAMAGAAAGGQIGGPYGAAIGAAVGALVGYFRGRAMQKDMDRIQNAVGVRVSEAMVKGIKDSAKNLQKMGFKGAGLFEGSLMSLSKIFDDVGGVAKFGMGKAAKSIGDLMNAVSLGKLPMKEGLAEIGASFGKLAAEAVKAGKVADKSLIDVVKRARDLGLEVPEIKEFVGQALEQAAAGLGGVIGGIKLVDQAGAQAQATLFSTTFWATVKEKGLFEAVQAFGTIFENLKSTLEAGGFAVDLGGVEHLFEIAKKPEFGPLLQGVSGLNDLLQGLSNSAYLSVDAFAAIQQQAGAAFQQMLASGLSNQEALQVIAPLLGNIIKASQAFGFTIDANTQGLIDQAAAAGIGFKTEPMEKMVGLLEIIATKLGATADELGRIGGAANNAANAFGNMANAAGAVGSGAGGGGVADMPEAHLAAGGFSGMVGPGFGGPKLFLAGEGSQPEMVNIGPTGGVAGGGGSREIVINIQMPVNVDLSGVISADPVELARLIAQGVDIAVRDNMSGLKTRIQDAATEAA